MKHAVGIIIVLGVVVGGGFLLANGQNVDTRNGTAGLTIATSFYPLEFAINRIIGDQGSVINIGAGRDPHDYEPSTQDMVAMQRADAVVLQGADFEPWGDDVQASLKASDVPVLIATSDITLHEGGHDHGEEDNHEDESRDDDHASEHEEEHDQEHEAGHDEESHDHEDEHEEGHSDEHEHGAYDPHTWLDPVLFSETVGYLAAEMAALDPDNADIYLANAATLQAELAALDTQYQTRLANCALNEVITSHDAFGYVGDRYDFKIHAIAGLSTQDTPSATTLAGLKKEAEEGIGAILLEENSITAYGETLARETGLQTLSLNPIAYSISAHENYVTLMQSNLESFATALACNE
jgi:zinc transport system substrate-binding protein